MLPENFSRDQFIADMRAKHSRILPPEVEFSVGEGWLPIIADSLRDIEVSLETHGCLPRASVRQIKEKFGGLRIYVRPQNEAAHFPSALAAEILAIRDRAESLSMRTCELCGDPGELITSGYMQTLCRNHAGDRA